MPPGKRELLEQPTQPVAVFGDVAVDLGVGALQIDVGDQGRRAMSRAGEKDDIQVIFLDQAVEVNVGEAHARIGAPVTEQAPLDVLGLQRLTQQRIVSQVDHPRRQEQGRVPIGLHALQLLGLERAALDSGTRRTVGADRLRFSHNRVHTSLRDPPCGRVLFHKRTALICINVRTRSQQHCAGEQNQLSARMATG